MATLGVQRGCDSASGPAPDLMGIGGGPRAGVVGARQALAIGLALSLAACGGAASAPASTAPSTTAPTSAAPAQSAAASVAAKPPGSAAGAASASAKPAASAAAKPSGSAAASAAAGGTPIKIGFSQYAAAFTPLFVGKEMGMFSKNGLDLTLQQIGGPAAVPALLADEVQADLLGANEVTRAVLAGADLTAVATLSDVPVFDLVADKKYKTVQDLDGQSIGVTSLGSSTDVTARLFLDHFGMTGKVKVVPAGGTNTSVFAALQQGVVAAAIQSPEAAAESAKAGFVPIVDGVKLGVPLNFSVVAFKKSYVKDHLATAKSFLKGYQQAWTYAGDPANKAATIKIQVQYLKIPADSAEVGYDAWSKVWAGQKVPTIGAESVANVLKFSDDPKARAAKPEEFIDNSLLQSVQ